MNMEAIQIDQTIQKILDPRENHGSRFIESYDDVVQIVEKLRSMGHTIVFTSGVWDLKHVGHERYLIAGRKEGTILVVGCDTNELTRKKGPDRPVVTMEERVEQLINLRSVDIVVPIYSHEQADDLIARMKPDILIISVSTEKNKPEHTSMMEHKHKENCGRLVILPPQAVTSTTARVRNLMLGGIKEFKNKLQKALDDLQLEFENGGGDDKK